MDRVEPCALWFEVGFRPIPAKASKLAQPGWPVNIVLGRKRGTWHIPRGRQRLPVAYLEPKFEAGYGG